GARGADLSRIEEDRARRALDGLLEIGVREDNDRRLAAELEGEPLEVASRRSKNRAADLGRPRERYLVDARMLDECRTRGLAVTGHDVDGARREPHLLGDLAKVERR